MFILDDILLAPAKGFLWIVRELQKAAEDEAASESDDLTARLSTLYMQLETGQITQDQFDEQERTILDRLDAIAARGDPAATTPDDDDDDSDDPSDESDEADEADESDDDDPSGAEDAEPESRSVNSDQASTAQHKTIASAQAAADAGGTVSAPSAPSAPQPRKDAA